MRAKSMITLAAVLTVAVASAQETPESHQPIDSGNWWNTRRGQDNGMLYTAGEFDFDMFGSYVNPESELNDLFDTNIRHGAWGGGAGLSYFFLRNVGIGTDFNVSDHPGGDWDVDYWVGDLYLRMPIGRSPLSPYLFGSGGRGITPTWQWVYGGGVGLELRFTHNFGIFSDARFLWADKSTEFNTLGIRAGFRFAF